MNDKQTFIDRSQMLKHHGIIGQRWGVRRTPEELGYKRSNPRSNVTVSEEEDIVETGLFSTKRGKQKTGRYLVEATAKNGERSMSIVDAKKLASTIADMEDWIKNTDIFNETLSDIRSAQRVSSKYSLSDDELNDLVNGPKCQKMFNSLITERGYDPEKEQRHKN